MLERSIPKLENELKQLSEKFTNDKDSGHGMQAFQVYGKDIHELIELDWAAFHEEKEKRKEMRVRFVLVAFLYIFLHGDYFTFFYQFF